VTLHTERKLPATVGFHGYRTPDQAAAYHAYCQIVRECAGEPPSETQITELEWLWWRMNPEDRRRVPVTERPLPFTEGQPWE